MLNIDSRRRKETNAVLRLDLVWCYGTTYLIFTIGNNLVVVVEAALDALVTQSMSRRGHAAWMWQGRFVAHGIIVNAMDLDM